MQSQNQILNQPPPDQIPQRTPTVREGPSPSQTISPPPTRTIKTHDLAAFTSQLASLLKAGFSLVPALSAMIEQLQNHPLHPILTDIRANVNAGQTLDQAMADFPNTFSSLYRNMVAAALTAGNLDTVLLSLAELLRKKDRLNKKIQAALAYPILLIVTALSVLTFLIAFVIPNITAILTDLNRELPLLTRALIAVGNTLQSYLWLFLLAPLLIAALIKFALKNKANTLWWHQQKLKLPIIGNFSMTVETARITRTLSLLLKSQIPILNAFQITRQIVQNTYLAAALDNVRTDIAEGATIANALKKTNLFEPIFCHTIAIAETSGNLDHALADLAEDYDHRIDHKTTSFVALFEPIMLLTMGLIVGLVVLAILLPIFEINQSI